MPWFSASSDVQQVHLHVVASDNDLEALWARQPQAARRNTLRYVVNSRRQPLHYKLPPMLNVSEHWMEMIYDMSFVHKLRSWHALAA